MRPFKVWGRHDPTFLFIAILTFISDSEETKIMEHDETGRPKHLPVEEATTHTVSTALSKDQRLERQRVRRKAGLEILPATAVVASWYVEEFDPYGDDPPPEEYRGYINREYFARSPGSDVWIHVDDLPATFWSERRQKLAFLAMCEHVREKLIYRIQSEVELLESLSLFDLMSNDTHGRISIDD
jgi:hypothetical protein